MRFLPQLRILIVIGSAVLFGGCARPDSPRQTSRIARETMTPSAAPAGSPTSPSGPAAARDPEHTVPDTILAWDAKEKTYRAKPGEESALFAFNVTNVSQMEVVIKATATSCGCTVAELPADPWKIPPGGHGRISVTMDLNGQADSTTKGVMVFTSKGIVTLTVEAIIPD